MPLCEVWLKPLSSKPPESETMQALKSIGSAVADDSGASDDSDVVGSSVRLLVGSVATCGQAESSNRDDCCETGRLLHGAS